MATPQSFKNHTRFDPPFHFFVAPVLLLNFLYMIYRCYKHWPEEMVLHLWWIILALALFVLAGLARGYSLKDQDRIIRLEEQLRLAALVPSAELAQLRSLNTKQLIALRFASDAELPGLALRAATHNLDQKQIKQAITVWRPDNERV
jgi:hypothetical protein